MEMMVKLEADCGMTDATALAAPCTTGGSQGAAQGTAWHWQAPSLDARPPQAASEQACPLSSLQPAAARAHFKIDSHVSSWLLAFCYMPEGRHAADMPPAQF